MIRALIIDDEPPARSRMRRLLGTLDGCEVAGEAASSRQALELIPQLQPDVLLLDISMPGMDGMALAETLKSMPRQPAVVFCTAWPDRALDAFDCDAIDYLVKPIRAERLQAALDKVARSRNTGAPSSAQPHFLRSTVGGRTQLVPLDEVICLVAEDKYTTVIYASGKTVINESLVELEQRFPERLMRIHRKTLVAPEYIRGLEHVGSGPSFMLLEGTDLKPEISRRQLAAVRKYLRESG
jgi:two-component system response regulator AlgR